MFITDLSAIAPPTPIVAAHAYDALEFLRLGIVHLDTVLEAIAGDEDQGDLACGESAVYGLRQAIALPVSVLQEIVSGPPSMPERVFSAVRNHVTHYPDNLPGLEGSALALVFAYKSLDDAIAADNGSRFFQPFDDFLAGVREIVVLNIVESEVRGFWAQEAMEAILANKPYPSDWMKQAHVAKLVAKIGPM